jgi:hypothetical protein
MVIKIIPSCWAYSYRKGRVSTHNFHLEQLVIIRTIGILFCRIERLAGTPSAGVHNATDASDAEVPDATDAEVPDAGDTGV